MGLSAHNTIFLLPRLQHIVLFRKQTFQPILFAVVCGSGGGRARTHLGKCMRHTQENGAEERKLVRNPDTPKGRVTRGGWLLHSPSLFFPCCRGSQTTACELSCLRIPWDVCKHMRIPRSSPSLTGQGSLKGGTRSWHLTQDCGLSWPSKAASYSLCLRMSPLFSSPGQRLRHANSFSKTLIQGYHRTHPLSS